VEQPKKQKKKKRKIREKVKERVKERMTQRRKKTAVKRARESERRKNRIHGREKRVKSVKREKRGGVWLFPFSRVVFAIGALIVIAVVVFIVLTLKSKLVLTLTFAQDVISIEDEIKVDVEQTEISVENKAIPG